MKKITILTLLTCTISFAQSPTNYNEALTSNAHPASNSGRSVATMSRVDTNRMPIIETYTDLANFNAGVLTNCPNTVLTSENFTNGPTTITPCGLSISSAGDSCFAVGEIEDGFIATASSNTDMVNIPAGAIGNTDSLIGASAFAEFTIATFDPPVFAVAADVWENSNPDTSIRIYGIGDVLIETYVINAPIETQAFVGLISDEQITRIELEGMTGSGELFGNFVYGAICTELSVNDNLQSQVSISPNPTTNILFIQTTSQITIDSVQIFDALGKTIPVSTNKNQIDTSILTSGVYFLKINTTEGTLTKKFVKK
ncbi:MAG: T9SS type A sorting domain-containing protein [Patiriisocius sp.]|uniref:T9SS type A sorting domain-containing protein n=1 Tax=Patiriisocius sp. TaxID=2822396 RepID=UPI003EF1E315